MQAYTELLPPSAVTHAVYLPFTAQASRNLVVAKTSLLQVYNILRHREALNDTGDGSDHGEVDSDAAAPATSDRLALVAEYPLSGSIRSLASVRAQNTKSGGEALLVATSHAKVSLLEWDPETHNITTVSIHYYEGEQLQGSSWVPDLSHWPCYLTVEPNSRCAALKFGQRHIAILPFHQVGDDLVMGDEDHDLDEQDGSAPKHDQQINGNGNAKNGTTPYLASFVLPLTALDPSIIQPADVAFLHEYREPTLGVLSSSIGGASSMLRKDVMTYTAFTLDLEQKARTPLLSVSGLPSDLFKLVPLPLPVGGVLLVGGNELIHIDQAGKSFGVGVNEFARQASAFTLADESELALQLEGCVVAPLNTANGDLLLSLSTGHLAVLSFRLDGRSVSGLTIAVVPVHRGGDALPAAASCAVSVDSDLVFLGSEDADAILLSGSSPTAQLPRRRPGIDTLGVEADDSEEDLEDEDDLYGGDGRQTKRSANETTTVLDLDNVRFEIRDRLPNYAPSAELTICKHRPIINDHRSQGKKENLEDYCLAFPSGRNGAGSITVLLHSLPVTNIHSLELANVHRLWTVRLKPPAANKTTTTTLPKHDNFCIVSHVDPEGQESSSFHSVSDTGLEQVTESDFEADVGTLTVGVMNDGAQLVQISKGELRCYDTAFDFPQIVPMIDEETDAELKITHTSFTDRHVLIIRDDSSLCILQMDQKGELEELEQSPVLTASKWSSGCLYHNPSTKEDSAVLLDLEDSIHVFRLPDLSAPIITYDGFPHLPPYISRDYSRRRLAARINIRDLHLTDFGDVESNSLHMILRTSNDDVVIYQAFQYPYSASTSPLTTNTRWRKVNNLYAPVELTDEEADGMPTGWMKTLRLADQTEAVLIPGRPNRLLLKEHNASVTTITIPGDEIVDIDSIHALFHGDGLTMVRSDGGVSLAQVTGGFQPVSSGWSVRRMLVGKDVDGVAFHAPSNLYVVGTNSRTPFNLVEDDWHPEWAKEGDSAFRPHVPQGSIELLHPETGAIIDSVTLLPRETLLSLQVMSLEVSEVSHEQRMMIVAGTAVVLGEDNVTNGAVYVFDVPSVVPEPDRPETKYRLRQIVREDVRGAVTAMTEIGSSGLMLHAQGQKCMVRGLKEDQSLLPVAFMDVQCYVTVLKGLKGTGIALMADAVKGLWLSGYSPEPYRMQLFGKSRSRLEVLAADFLPDNKQLFMVAADATCNLHVFEFNPEDPMSLSGQRLLQRGIFHTGHFPRSINLLSTSFDAQMSSTNGNSSEMDIDDPAASSNSDPQYQVLVASASGSIALLSPLTENTYRRLAALQAHLTNVLEHPAGLNPRAYRAAEVDAGGGSGTAGPGTGPTGTRGIIDGGLLRRWGELSVQRRHEALGRAGVETWQLVREFEVLGGSGLWH